MRIAAVRILFCLIPFCLMGGAPALADTGICTINGKPDEQVQLYNKPAGNPSSKMKSGTRVIIHGGGHDTLGRTWVLIQRQGGFIGWILRTGLTCF